MSKLKQAIERLRSGPGQRLHKDFETDLRLVCDAAARVQRLSDLVRHQRMELHEAELISDEEYAALLEDSESVKRLCFYDELKAAHAKELAEARLHEHDQHGNCRQCYDFLTEDAREGFTPRRCERGAELQAAVKGASCE